MEQPDEDDWGKRAVKVIAREVRRWRMRRQLSAQALADATARLGWPIKRTVLSNLETGYRETITVPELYVLAAALEVPPLLLLLPLGHQQTVEPLPEVRVPTETAFAWLRGEMPLPGGVWEGREDAMSPTVNLFVMHGSLVHQWRWHRLFAEKMRDLPGGADEAKEREQQAEKTADTLLGIRAMMRRQDLTPPSLPPELAALEEVVA